MRDFTLSYDNITLRPKYSTLPSRSQADTSIIFGGKTFKLPVVPANMRDVIDIKNAKFMSENDYFYIMHRFDNITSDFVKLANNENWKSISISIGVSENDKFILQKLSDDGLRIDFITIDVAHAHHSNVESMIHHIKNQYPDAFLIVGNIATAEAAYFLSDFGVDAVKVGIGGGSICTTRYMTGFHLPTLQSVDEVAALFNFKGVGTHIIADGGAKHYGDITKALRFGATMVMSGGWFASCIDSPASIIDGKKIYRGSTAYASKGEHRHIEGKTLELDGGFTYNDRLKEIKESLQSSISYAGGTDLSSFDNIEWQWINKV